MPRGPAHRLSDLDPEARTATCAICGPVRVRNNRQRGEVRWRCAVAKKAWDRHANQRTKLSKNPHRRFVGSSCARCVFQHEDERVFDVHHRDGDHANNDPTNLETLCPTCHRLHHLGLLGASSP